MNISAKKYVATAPIHLSKSEPLFLKGQWAFDEGGTPFLNE